MSKQHLAEESGESGRHTIRLSGAWEVRQAPPEVDAGELDELVKSSSPVARVTLSAIAGQPGLDGLGTTVASRRFNRPSNLSAGQQVSLQITGLPQDAVLYFNGQRMKPSGEDIAEGTAHTVSIGERLRDNNRIDVVATGCEFLAGGQVVLAIDDQQ